MESRHSPAKLTYDDYLRLPDDDLRHEIIDGEHFVTPSPVTRHQRIAGDLYYTLRRHLEANPLGEVFIAPFDVVLSVFDIVVPDLIYLSKERAHFLTAKNLQGPPDVVVEILSPGTRKRDETLKRDLYERVGVREFWLVDPDRSELVAYGRGPAGYAEPRRHAASSHHVVTTTLLPGLEIPLQRLLVQ